MGYYTTFSGELTFSRPLTFAELRGIPEQACFELDRLTEARETEEGTLQVHTAHGITCKWDTAVKAYNVLAELNAIVDALPDDVDVAGELRGEGEESGDIRRYVSQQDRYIAELTPTLVWSDGHQEAAR